MSEILTRVLKNSPHDFERASKDAVGGSWSRCDGKLGRKPGSFKVDDAALVEQLSAVTRDSAQVHMKTKQPMRTLELSKRRAAAATRLGKSQLCKRLASARLPIQAARVARGKCDACQSWKNFGRIQVASLIGDRWLVLAGLLHGYWARFEKQIEEELLDTYELERCDNPEFVDKMTFFCETHDFEADPPRDHLPADQLVRLAAEEVATIEALRGQLEDLSNISWHWALKASVDAAWMRCWYSPCPTTLYGLWDHMAIC